MKRHYSVSIHPAGAVVLAAAFLFAPSHQVLAVLLALFWHEAGHLLAMLLCGVKRCHVEITPFGGMADAKDFDFLSPGRQAAISAAGVAASALGAYCCRMMQPAMFVHVLMQMNLSLAVINCLPVWPLDGARLLCAAAAKLGLESAAKKLLSVLARVTGAGLVLLGLYGVWHGAVNLSLLLGGPYLCYAARGGSVSDSVRRIEACEGKLERSLVMPVSARVCYSDQQQAASAAMLAHPESARYHLLLLIDRKTGQLEQIRTESEMLQAAFEPLENIARVKPVDKG